MLLSWCFLALIAASCAGVDEPKIDSPKTTETEKHFEQLFKDFLFDPTGAQRVRVKADDRSYGARLDGVERTGWLVPAKGNRPARLYFLDGDSMPAPPEKMITKIDFVAECRERFAEDNDRFIRPETDSRITCDLWRRHVEEVEDGLDLILAAWLYRLGEGELAAKGLERASQNQVTVAKVRRQLARNTFADLVFAYEAYQDAEAVEHGSRLCRLYPAEAKAFPQAQRLVDELKRRQRKGSFAKWPDDTHLKDFGNWPTEQRIPVLIEWLEEITSDWERRGGGNFGAEWREPFSSLVRYGDAAVPFLIDAIENNDFLTRRVIVDQDESYQRSCREPRVQRVRGSALQALHLNLRVWTFTAATGEKVLTGDPKQLAEAVRELRDYWKKYGKYPFAERMVKVLCDPEASYALKREAALNLGLNDQTSAFSLHIQCAISPLAEPLLGDHYKRWQGSRVISSSNYEKEKKEQPTFAQGKNPTPAEAILRGLSHELETNPQHRIEDKAVDGMRWIEDDYLLALIELGDQRIGEPLAALAKGQKTARLRRKLAYAAYCLGEDRAWRAYADDARAGKIRLPDDNQLRVADNANPALFEVAGMADFLTRVRLPESERALLAFTKPSHPYYALLAQVLLADRPRYTTDGYFKHPYCLAILRNELDNTAKTGRTFSHSGPTTTYKRGNSPDGNVDLSDSIRNMKLRDTAEERVCDCAAVNLSSLVFGASAYHALLVDSDKAFERLKKEIDLFDGRFRLSDRHERVIRLDYYSRTIFMPDLGLLGRPATADDVAAGKAIFHLDGKGKVADFQLPATAVWDRHASKMNSEPVFIVQAETANGLTKYGVIARHTIVVLSAEELVDIKPFVKEEPDD